MAKLTLLFDEQVCNKCLQIKSISEFYLRKKRNTYMRICKKCTTAHVAARYAEVNDEGRESNRNYYNENKEQIQKRRIELRKTDLKTNLSYLLNNSRTRARVKNMDFDLDISFLLNLWAVQNGKCFYSGQDMEFTGSDAVSIDRLDSDLGYTKDNVNFVCRAVNYMKRDIPHLDFIALCKVIGSRQ